MFPRESRGNCLICIFSKGGTWFAEAREITINILNVTNIELLLSIDFLRQVDLTYHKKEKRKTTNSGSREACVLQACARGVAPCSSGCELWDASKTFLRKKEQSGIPPGQVMKLFVPAILVMKVTSLKNIFNKIASALHFQKNELCCVFTWEKYDLS